MNNQIINTENTNRTIKNLNDIEMRKCVGGIPKVGVKQWENKKADCSTGHHEYVYTGREKPGDIISCWPDKEMVCKKCGLKVWANW